MVERMPNRIIREGIIDSSAVNSLSPEAEVFYRRLMNVVDDYGRFDGRLPVLRARLYPLQLEKVREASLERWIAECVKARLIRLYEHKGSQYIEFHKLGSPRAKASKYPPPPDDCAQTQADASMCAQPQEDVPYSSSYSGSYSSSNSRERAAKPPLTQKPTVEEVAAYCRERGNSIDPQRFVDYYTANGWKVGRSSMKDWKAAVRNWEKNEKVPARGGGFKSHDERVIGDILDAMQHGGQQ